MKPARQTLLLLLSLLGASWMQSANAVPAFATKYEKNCSYCHNAWPQLNAKGREFKELGYRLPADLRGEPEDAAFFEPGYFPISALVKARPYDKKDSGDTKVRALQELEVFVAGAIGRHFSTFIEFEIEDEHDFEVEVPAAFAAFNYNRLFNVNLTWGPFLYPDPYSTLDSRFRLTRSTPSFLAEPFGGADGVAGSIAGERQSVSVSGRAVERLFYIAGIAGEAGDTEGVEASNFFGRVAVDVTKDIMIGAFGVDGETQERTVSGTTTQTVGGVPGVVVTTSTAFPMREFNRYGVDFQADIGLTRVQGAYVRAEDDTAAGTSTVENDAWSVQAFHTFRTRTGQPTFVPIVRFDSYERNDGSDKYDELTLNLTYYWKENMKGMIEYWDQMSAPATANSGFGEDNRLTLQFAVAF